MRISLNNIAHTHTHTHILCPQHDAVSKAYFAQQHGWKSVKSGEKKLSQTHIHTQQVE